MNIQNRLRKLESQKGVSEFCSCLAPKCQITYQKNGEPMTLPEFWGNRVIPDVCPTCGKPINKTVMIIDFVSSQMPKPEDAG